MTQIISRNGVVICVTTVPYPDWIIRDMKRNVYYDILIKPKTHKMTLEEIEKKLGYKVEIVSGK